MNLIVDTHIIFWNLLYPEKLSFNVVSALNSSTNIFLPTIVLLELDRLFRKANKYPSFEYFYQNLQNQSKYIVYPLDQDVLKEYLLVKNNLEIHDRVIVATAKYLDAQLVSKDLEIRKVYPKVIW